MAEYEGELPIDERDWQDGYNRTADDPDPYTGSTGTVPDTRGGDGDPREPRPPVRPPTRPGDPTEPEAGEPARPGLEPEWRPDSIVSPRNSRAETPTGKNVPVALWLLLLLALYYIVKDS